MSPIPAHAAIVSIANTGFWCAASGDDLAVAARSLPTTRTAQRIAKATGHELTISFTRTR